MVEEKVKSIIDSLSNSTSDNFTDAICLSLAKAIKADFVFIAKINPEHTVATTLSIAVDGLSVTIYLIIYTPRHVKMLVKEICAATFLTLKKHT